MLSALREHLKERGWPKWLLLIVAASFTMYLGAYYSCDDGGGAGSEPDWAVKIGGEIVPAARFRAIARRLDANYREMLGQNYAQYRSQFRIGSQAVQQLLEQEIILRDARRLGLSVSDGELIERIRSLPELADSGGKFIGRDEYQRRIRNYPGGIAAFERDLADALLVDKWTALVSQTVRVDEREVEDTFRRRTEKSTIDYFLVPLGTEEFDRTLSDDQVRAWYDTHPERYRHDAGRKVRYVVVERQAQVAKVSVGDEEIRAHYDANAARYAHPEQRRASHVLFRVAADASPADKDAARAKARQALERARRGEDFATLARALSDDKFSAERGGDLGWFGRGQMVGAFEEAAFATAPGQLAELVETEFGVHVLRVDDARQAGTRPFEEVRAEIEQELLLRRADERTATETARIREKIPSADRLATVAAEEALPVSKAFVTSRDDLQALGLAPDAQSAVLELGAGAVSQPLRGARGAFVVVVDELSPAGISPFEEVADRVRGDLLDARSREAAIRAGRRALERGPTLAAAARAVGLEVKSSGDLAPGDVLPGAGGDSADVRRQIFGAASAVGARGVAEVPSGALVYEIRKRVPFDRAAFESARATLRVELGQQRRQSIVRSLVDQLSRQQEIVINEPLVQQLDSRS